VTIVLGWIVWPGWSAVYGEPPEKDAEVDRLPVPPSENLKDARRQIREIFEKDYTSAKYDTSKAVLAKKLLEQALKDDSDPVAYFALLREARDVAADGNIWDTVCEAVDAMEEKFEVNAWEMKEEMLSAAVKISRSVNAQERLCEAMLDVLNAAVEAQQFDIARKLVSSLTTASGRVQGAIGNVPLRRRFQLRAAELKKLEPQWAMIQQATSKLKESPDDPAANAAYGKHLCLVVGDWEHGLPLLAKGSDKSLAALARQEADSPGDATDQLKLADAWWNLGQADSGSEKKQLLLRSKHWYDTAVPSLTGLSRTKAEKRIETISKSYPEAPEATTRIPGSSSSGNDTGKSSKKRTAKTPAQTPRDVDRQMAMLVLQEQGGSVSVELPGQPATVFIASGGTLPNGPFLLRNMTVSRSTSNPNTQFSDDNLKVVAQLSRLQYLSLWGVPITDAGLAHLRGCPTLETLGLAYTAITDAGLAHLSNLPLLRQLDLPNTKVTDAGMVHLPKLARLQSLDLTETKVTGAGLRQLQKSPSLTSLRLNKLSLQNEDLAGLAGIAGLTSLQMEDTPFTGEGLKHLRGLPRLSTLILRGQTLPAASLASLAAMPNLRTLSLYECSVDDRGLNHLRSLENLQSLIVVRSEITDAGVVVLAGLPNLRSLNLERSKITGTGFRQFPMNRNVTYLSVSESPITDEGMQYIAAAFPNVQSLHLNGSAVTDSGLKHVSRLVALNYLNIAGTSVTAKGLGSLTTLRGLRTLSLSRDLATPQLEKQLKQALPACSISRQ
jgi:Leucine-rich repeat (LRR) protein